MTEPRGLPTHPSWTRGQKALAAGVAVGAVAIIAILVASLLSVRSLEVELRASEDAAEQFIAVMREASRVEAELLRAGELTAPTVERIDLLHRHVAVLGAGAAQQDLGRARRQRVRAILAADDDLATLVEQGGRVRDAVALASTLERAAKAGADIAESARRATLLGQIASARSVALGTLVAIAVLIGIIAALLLSLRRRGIRAYADAYDLAVARAEQLEDSNRQLEQANETKRRFLSMVSHELRTPLTVIRGFAETLAHGTGDLHDEQRRQLADAIVRHALRQQRMVDDLLVLARHADHTPDTSPRPIDLRDLLGRVVRDLPLSDSTVRVVPGPRCVAWADPHHVEQVVENLLTNADKYGGRQVEVSRTHTATEVVLVVEDDGPGVPEEFLPSLFSPFMQADDGDTRVSRGVGLGLSITQLLVEANGGTIAYAHRAGGGARFRVTLPRARPDHPEHTGRTGRPDAVVQRPTSSSA